MHSRVCYNYKAWCVRMRSFVCVYIRMCERQYELGINTYSTELFIEIQLKLDINKI